MLPPLVGLPTHLMGVISDGLSAGGNSFCRYYLTSHTSHDCAPFPSLHLQALSWRKVRKDGEEVWFNWVINASQHEQPDEMPQYLLDEVWTGRVGEWE